MAVVCAVQIPRWKEELSKDDGRTFLYLQLRLLLFGPSFPFVNDLSPQSPKILFRIFLNVAASGCDRDLRSLRRPARVTALTGQGIEGLGVGFDQPRTKKDRRKLLGLSD